MEWALSCVGYERRIKGTVLSLNKRNQCGNYPAVLKAVASALWHVPGRFSIARIVGRSYSLRCVVFHDVAVSESAFTRGMGISSTPSQFEVALQFLANHYTPVSLQDVLDDRGDGRELPSRAVLITFDDGYASLMETAIPACQKLGVPAVLFLNAAFLDNERLSADNLICYVANTLGMATINAATRVLMGDRAPKLQSLMQVFSRFLPSISLAERVSFLKALIDLGGINERQLAIEAGLYLTSKQVRELSSSGFEIGNHTRSHIHCRCLLPQCFGEEIERNKVELEALSGKPVRSFSVPYGSSADLSSNLVDRLRRSGHEAIFLSQAVANPCDSERICVDRVGPRAHSDSALFLELELLPRLRTIRNCITGRNALGRSWLHAPQT